MNLKWISMQDAHYQQERALRNRILLRPIGQTDGAWEHRDPAALHLVAVEEDQVVGCTLLLPHSPIEGQLMQMAVDTERQGQGLGKSLVHALCTRAEALGMHRVFCHAREPVIEFYTRLGFFAVGSRFEEVGIQHQKMIRDFRVRELR